MNSEDYIDPADGLLHCGKCSTPKQCVVKAFGRVTTQYCLCSCEQKRLAAEKLEREQQQVIADKRRRESISRAKSKKVDLILEMQNGDCGRITGSIKN